MSYFILFSGRSAKRRKDGENRPNDVGTSNYFQSVREAPGMIMKILNKQFYY